MNSLSRIIAFILWAILLGGIVSLLRRWALSSAGRGRRAKAPPLALTAPLYRDPQCGTFVSPEIAFPASHAGHTVHFCSAECRDRFLRSRGQRASA